MQRRELKGMFTGLTCSIALVLMATTAWAADGVSSFDAAQFFDNEGVSEHAEAQSLRAEYKLELQWTIGIDFPEANVIIIENSNTFVKSVSIKNFL